MAQQKQEQEQPKSVFLTLNAINVNEHVKKKKSGEKNPDGSDKLLTYLSWVWAWGQVKQHFPDATYQIRHWGDKPYLNDDQLGLMVETSVTIKSETITMWLPVMNSSNKAMKVTPYSYKTKYGDKYVEAATMYDVNKAIMRCLAKNIAMFGLGLYIYADEDLPEEEKKEQEARGAELLDKAIAEAKAATTNAELQAIYRKYQALLASDVFAKFKVIAIEESKKFKTT